MMGRAERDGWCILTTASGRTLPLARALSDAGLEVWTPVRTERRTGRGKRRKEVVQIEAPITPTFVFAAAAHLPELLRLRDLPVSPYPAFRLLRYGDRIPVVTNASLAPLRAAEERFRRSLLKSTRRRLEPGTSVRVAKGAFAGMTGIVEGGSDKEARVNFGSGFVVSIASCLFGTDVVQIAQSPALGIAA